MARRIFDAGGEQVQVLTHDPADRKRLSYLAASAEGKPIYLDRALADADLVIPIGCQRLDSVLGYFGLNSGLFPTFSDAKNLERYRAPLAARSPVQLRRMREEVDQVSWLLGVHFLVQVIPAGDEEILAVLAGRTGAVDRVARERCQAGLEIVGAGAGQFGCRGAFRTSQRADLAQRRPCDGRGASRGRRRGRHRHLQRLNRTGWPRRALVGGHRKSRNRAAGNCSRAPGGCLGRVAVDRSSQSWPGVSSQWTPARDG